MHTQTLQVTLRCLLQGLEEMGRRGGGQGDWGQLRKLGPQWAPVLDGLQEPLPQNRVTDLAHLARRLSTAGHETEGAGGTVDPLTPLATVFTHMGESTPVIFGPGGGRRTRCLSWKRRGSRFSRRTTSARGRGSRCPWRSCNRRNHR